MFGYHVLHKLGYTSTWKAYATILNLLYFPAPGLALELNPAVLCTSTIRCCSSTVHTQSSTVRCWRE